MATQGGRIISEDFEDGTAGGFDTFIEYQFVSPGAPYARFINDFISPPGHILFLGRSTVARLTFNTAPPQFINFASIDFGDSSGGGPATVVEFVGEDGVGQFSSRNARMSTVDTNGLALGRIIQINLYGSLESIFDNIVLEVVPEPHGLVLIGSAAILLTSRKWISTRRR
jgi:hypothetical protein